MKRTYALILATILSLAIAGSAWAKACIDWPRVMSTVYLEDQKDGSIIVLHSFKNFTKQPEDNWLTLAYRDFLADLLSTAKKVRVRSGLSAKHDPLASKPNYIIEGSFQRTPENLRVFIEVKNGIDGKIIKIFKVETPYPNNAEFFGRTARAAREMGDTMDLKFDDKEFDYVLNATDSTQAFEYYHKGMQLLTTYDPNNFDKAKTLFDQAKKTDFRSWLGYQGLLDLYTFQGLKAKQLGLPSAAYYQMAQRELAQMQSSARRPPAVPRLGKAKTRKKEKGEVKLTNRFLKGHAEFLRGMAAMQAGDMEEAADKLKKATELVPEDAMAWMELSRALSREGKVEDAAKAQQKARKVNPCL